MRAGSGRAGAASGRALAAVAAAAPVLGARVAVVALCLVVLQAHRAGIQVLPEGKRGFDFRIHFPVPDPEAGQGRPDITVILIQPRASLALSWGSGAMARRRESTTRVPKTASFVCQPTNTDAATMNGRHTVVPITTCEAARKAWPSSG